MTSGQQIAALVAITMRQNAIRESLSGDPSPEWVQRADKDLEDLTGAYAAIDAIETED